MKLTKQNLVRMPDGGILISFDSIVNRHNIADEIESQILENQEIVGRINFVLEHTKVLLNDWYDIPEELVRVRNLLEFLLDIKRKQS